MQSAFLRALALAVTTTMPLAAGAESLGLRFLEIEGAATQSGNDLRAFTRLSGDFAITAAHGLQFDLTLADQADGVLGQLDGHLYLMPDDRMKYGVFLSLGDVNGREATIGMVGAEGMFALAEDTTLQVSTALGLARNVVGNTSSTLDFIAAQARISQGFATHGTAFAEIGLTEVDEMALRATIVTAQVGVRWQMTALPVELVATVGGDALYGRDSAPWETVVRLGAVWRFGGGAKAGRPVAYQPFARPAAFDPLLRRGMF
jgi:hypothetical protein